MCSVDDEAVALLEDLVRIDSVNPGLVPGAAGERPVVEHLRARLESTGFTTTVVPGGPAGDRPSLVAVPPAVPDGATVVLNGHLDTVGVDGMSAPFEPRVEGDRLSARGAADMKGGVAAMVVAAERLVADGAPVRPVLALVADEEDANVGSEAVIDALPSLGVAPDLCLIGEPTDLIVCRSLRGFGVARVRLPGKASHSSQAELGVNALSRLARLVTAVDDRAVALREEGGDLMVSLAQGGRSAFVVPDAAECLVEMRTTPEQRAAQVVDEVRSLLDPEWAADTQLVARREGWRVDEAGPAADLSRRLDAALGAGTDFDAPYWMEAPLWQQVCPTLVCGPSGGGLHAVDEWVSLGQVRAFACALVSVLAGGRDGD